MCYTLEPTLAEPTILENLKLYLEVSQMSKILSDDIWMCYAEMQITFK
jgi:hypothetical protein